MTAAPFETLGCENPVECEEWYSLFKAFDNDNDGLIPSSDLCNILRISLYQFNLTENEADVLLSNVDQNKDQMIDFAEFCSLILKAKRMRMQRLMLYAARSVLPRSQQTEATRYLLHYSCMPPPIFLITISLLQLIVYLYYVIESGAGFSLTKPAPVDSPLILNPYKKQEVWRYFTYMFIHVGYSHLLTNLVVQILLGIPLELVHKFWRIGLIYILGVMSGALLFFVVDNNRPVFLAGASGGVYTLLSAHIANVVVNWSEMEFNWLRTTILAIFVSADVGQVIYQSFNGVPTKVSYISHLGGFIAGLLLGIVVLRNLRKRKWEAYAWWISLSFFVFYVSACIIIILSPPIF